MVGFSPYVFYAVDGADFHVAHVVRTTSPIGAYTLMCENYIDHAICSCRAPWAIPRVFCAISSA